MRAVGVACRELVRQLRDADFSATLDPELLDPPAVWVQPRTIHDLTLGDSAALTVYLWSVVGNFDAEHALELLDDGLAGLLAVLDDHDVAFADVDDPIVFGPVQLPGQSVALPAYRIAVDLDL